MHPMLTMGIRAARAAGDFLIRSLERVDSYPVSVKGRNDFVTDIDRQAEQIIITTLKNAYPEHAVLAEESGAQGEGDYVWIIDPLDGTTNYLHQFPQFAVSIALQHKAVTEQGIVYDPLRQELFTASRGGGAYLNNRRIRVSNISALELALLGTGFPYRGIQQLDGYLDTFKRIMQSCAGVRRPGAAALDLAYVACGRLDGFWEFGLRKWDIAAGEVLIREAGGLTSEIYTGASNTDSGDILAGNPKIHAQLARLFTD